MVSKNSTLADRLWEAVKQEPVKYRRLGWGKYVSLLTMSLYFTLYLDFLKIYWPTGRAYLSQHTLFYATVLTINICITSLYNLAMYFIYTRKIPFFQQYRVDPKLAWPWEKDPQNWPALLKDSILTTIFNLLTLAAIGYLGDFRSDFKYETSNQAVPTISTMLWQIIFMLVVHQILFYLAHGLLHTRYFYWIHKKHHKYYSTATPAAQYSHPFEAILSGGLPTALGYVILVNFCPVHVYTVLIWATFRTFQVSDGHCGYDFPWTQSALIPFSAGGDYHSFHHSSNTGNYSAITHIIDTIMGTESDYPNPNQIAKDKPQ